MSSVDSLSPFFLGCLIVGVFSIVIEIGYQAGKRITREEGLSKHPLESSVTTAILSLLAFLLAFSFGAAGTRYSKMRSMALDDANLAGTLYLRCDLLPEGDIQAAKSLVREYLQGRMEAIDSEDPARLAVALERSQEIQQELWGIAVQARMVTESMAVNLFIISLNDLIDNDLARQSTAFSNRLPTALWYSLGFLGLLATIMLGISSGLHGRRSRLATTTLIVAFSSVIVLIVDLDRPFRSLFNRGDAASEHTLQGMSP